MIDKNIILKKLFLGNKIIQMDDFFNICYVFDHGAVRGAGVSICSVCENNKNDKFIFHALCTDNIL